MHVAFQCYRCLKFLLQRSVRSPFVVLVLLHDLRTTSLFLALCCCCSTQYVYSRNRKWTFHHRSLKTQGINNLSRFCFIYWPLHICSSSPRINVHGLLASVPFVSVCVCVCKGRVWACGISWEMSTKALNLDCKLIKAVEQMVQTWSGHNETVSGETNRTWQDSCEGFVRWPAFRPLPGARLSSSQEGRNTTAWKLWSCFLRSQPVLTCSKRAFAACPTFTGSEWVLFFFNLSVLFHPQSSDLGRCLFVLFFW